MHRAIRINPFTLESRCAKDEWRIRSSTWNASRINQHRYPNTTRSHLREARPKWYDSRVSRSDGSRTWADRRLPQSRMPLHSTRNSTLANLNSAYAAALNEIPSANLRRHSRKQGTSMYREILRILRSLLLILRRREFRRLSVHGIWIYRSASKWIIVRNNSRKSGAKPTWFLRTSNYREKERKIKGERV